ncbi:hypothetical protein [Streptomyces sp. NPDC052114]|uniref:hypothetical protein n=1 Tax=unclassified Streptomyces TaxID=2593676 RepID=UPI0034158B8D
MDVISTERPVELAGSVRSAPYGAGAAAPLRAVQGTVLADLLTSYPYNSAAQLHEYFGEGPLPASYGGTCAWQSFEAGRLVAEHAGVAAEYRFDGRHVAAVYHDADGITVLDPYLLHRAPLRLERADAVDGAVSRTAEAYPLRSRADGSPAPSGVRVRWQLDDDSIQLNYLRFSPRRGHNVISRAFVLRPEQVLGPVPPAADAIRPQLLHPEQHSVSVRVVHPGTQQLAELILPLAGRQARMAVRGMISKDNQGVVARHGTRAFDKNRETVADAVGVAPGDVEDVLLRAAALHRAAAPAGLELPAYSQEDE